MNNDELDKLLKIDFNDETSDSLINCHYLQDIFNNLNQVRVNNEENHEANHGNREEKEKQVEGIFKNKIIKSNDAITYSKICKSKIHDNRAITSGDDMKVFIKTRSERFHEEMSNKIYSCLTYTLQFECTCELQDLDQIVARVELVKTDKTSKAMSVIHKHGDVCAFTGKTQEILSKKNENKFVSGSIKLKFNILSYHMEKSNFCLRTIFSKTDGTPLGEKISCPFAVFAKQNPAEKKNDVLFVSKTPKRKREENDTECIQSVEPQNKKKKSIGSSTLESFSNTLSKLTGYINDLNNGEEKNIIDQLIKLKEDL